MKLGELVKVLRSKNADPFTVTVDIVFRDEETYRRVKASGRLTAARVAKAYRIPEERVLKVIFYDQALAVKIAILRETPAGHPGCRDVYGCQQHVPLLDLEI